MDKKLYWFKEWLSMAEMFNITVDAENRDPYYWSTTTTQILHEVSLSQRNQAEERGRLTTTHDLYCNINRIQFPNYILDTNSIHKISTIFKARGGLLPLNSNRFMGKDDSRCDICNLRETENTFHVIAICPIYTEIRKLFYNKSSLTMSETLDELNGKDWERLYQFLKSVISYRCKIINEFE